MQTDRLIAEGRVWKTSFVELLGNEIDYIPPHSISFIGKRKLILPYFALHGLICSASFRCSEYSESPIVFQKQSLVVAMA